MRALIACLAVAIASDANAKSQDTIRSVSDSIASQTIEIGAPGKGAKVTRVDVSLWVQQARTIATLELELVGTDDQMRDVTLPLRLPPSSRPVGMEVQIGGVKAPASLLAAREAREFYEKTVAAYKDPGLLEGRGQEFSLRVFPVVAKETSRVELTILLPRMSRLSIVPVRQVFGRLDVDVLVDGRSNHHDSFLKVASARRIELADPAPSLTEDPAFDRGSVDATHSLVAGRAGVSGVFPTVLVGGLSGGARPWAHRSIDKTMIRQRIKLMNAKLSYCYERELFRDKTLSGTVDVQFAIENTGKVTVLSTAGTLTDAVVQKCVTGVFESLEFPAHDDNRIVVNYPVRYYVAGQ